ncbi:potassium channel protein [Altererythrobacter salegens]|uniref:Potassium channel protein n=1 Tax=Croceibacterium salegens TaxID=1737568 RepID=A0A6I4STJ7_9SPHN|nr:potassium channel protein [Croceibacterium salegens]MXO58226.1 potassium channel protein [Croceibacterium salegens]
MDRAEAAAEQLFEGALGSPLRNLAAALTFVITVWFIATLGFVAAGWTVSDAFYMVTLTIFSVGYGEVHPLDTPWLRLLDIGTIILGCTGMIVLTGALVQAFAHYQVTRLLGLNRMHHEIERLAGHTIICGLGRIGRQLAAQLHAAKSPFVVIERDADKVAEARTLGYLAIQADAAEEEALKEAGIDRARVLASVLPNDAANVFITLSARSLNAGVEIIARGEAPTTENKLIHAGASKVVMPTHIGAEHIAEQILYPHTDRLLDGSPRLQELRRNLEEFGLEIEVATAAPGGALTGRTVAEAETRGGGAFFVVQIDRPNGAVFPHPPGDFTIETADRVVLVLRGDKVAAGTIFAAPAEPVRVGRNRIR